ncbi:MAG: 50S ribosomal protein L35 [Pseudolysinimonas sp.]|uniref:50S ribosomal protein L35 n=1 Tax=Pseudolysinimonas sp. TaxID=2680009 RepID=UPI0032659EC4
MPKMKSHSGAKKRFKVTGTGKVLKQGAGMRHHLEVKPSRVTRRLNGDVELPNTQAKIIKRLLGKSGK